MPNLKDLRSRKKSVQATQKITAAMKMVAGAKFRRFQQQRDVVLQSKPHLHEVIQRLLAHVQSLEDLPALLKPPEGKAKYQRLVVLLTSDRGLCGSFNQQLLRSLRDYQQTRQQQGEQVAFYCLGRKGYDALRRGGDYWVLGGEVDIGSNVTFEQTQRIFQQILGWMGQESLGHVTLAYNQFRNVLLQTPTFEPLLPLEMEPHPKGDLVPEVGLYGYEPGVSKMLEGILPLFCTFQLYKAMVDSHTSELGARMTAMDNATRNADDMIKRLELIYNRTRQAYITRELIEIISGAEAL